MKLLEIARKKLLEIARKIVRSQEKSQPLNKAKVYTGDEEYEITKLWYENGRWIGFEAEKSGK